MKLFGGGVVAIVLTAAPGEVSGRRLIADAALVALAANLGNLLDRAPGRTIKVGLLAYIPIALAAGTAPVGLALVPVVGRRRRAAPGRPRRAADARRHRRQPARRGARPGRRARDEPAGPHRRADRPRSSSTWSSERVSFTKVIDATPGLRHLDRLGRRPD